MAVQIEEREGVLVAALANPPVNALSAAVRQGLAAAVTRAEAKGRPLVLIGQGGRFSAGADVTEFGKPPQAPVLPDLLLALERSAVPVCAAIEGDALGGGLELALACDWRAAAPGARLGLPEVNLGLIPGAGGTQRLPRLIGAERALGMITGGKPVPGADAQSLGLVDALDEDALAAAIDLARRGKRARPDSAERPDEAVFDDARRALQARYPLEPARRAAVDAVAASTALPLDEGLEEERRLFQRLMASPESRSLRHAFAAERAAAKPPAHAKDATPRRIETAAVIGAGAMGRGIALVLSRAGIETVLTDRSADALSGAQDALAAIRRRDIDKGRLSPEAANEAAARLSFAEALPPARDLYVEAVFERFATKQTVLGAAAEAGGPEAILATNTSYLDVDRLADSVVAPERVIGLHFFNPAHIMRLLEVVEGRKTAPDVLAAGFALGKKIGKIPVRAGVCHGFIGNRMFQAYQREAGLMLLQGVEPEEVDAALRRFGMPMGPFETVDLAGLDVGTAMRSEREPGSFDARAFSVHDGLSAEGRNGRKTGQGFYLYEDGKMHPYERPGEIARENAARYGIKPAALSEEDMIDRCILAMTAEGFALLAEGIALKEGDVDTVLLHGYGFPRAKCGPLFHARTRSLPETLARAEALSRSVPEAERWWRPGIEALTRYI